MEKTEFERLIKEGFELLPEWVRKKIKNVAILVENEPPEEVRKREGLVEDETLFGLYQGIPLSARGENYGVGPTMPDTITLYKTPIEIAAEEDGVPVAKVIADTIWHEFAHHFGMEENDVRTREQKRNNKH